MIFKFYTPKGGKVPKLLHAHIHARTDARTHARTQVIFIGSKLCRMASKLASLFEVHSRARSARHTAQGTTYTDVPHAHARVHACVDVNQAVAQMTCAAMCSRLEVCYLPAASLPAGRTHARTHVLVHGRTHARARTDGRTDGRKDGCTDVHARTRTDGR